MSFRSATHLQQRRAQLPDPLEIVQGFLTQFRKHGLQIGQAIFKDRHALRIELVLFKVSR